MSGDALTARVRHAVWRARSCFRSFPPLQAMRVLLVRLVQRVLDPYMIPSYSQTGEDRIIAALLSVERPGFYVDVGAHHPARLSNSLFLYEKGWRGVCIDANARLIERHRRMRPLDTAVNAVVSDSRSPQTFTEFAEAAVSSVSGEHVERHRASGRIVRQDVVQPRSLDEILEEAQVPARFDLLSIDVEGHDLEALRSLDLAKFRPRLVVIEMHGFDMRAPDSHAVYRHLVSRGYRLIGYAVMNAYFEDSETRAGV
jgi:FkbM family methyltransferase